jgi:hypothetical protein
VNLCLSMFLIVDPLDVKTCSLVVLPIDALSQIWALNSGVTLLTSITFHSDALLRFLFLIVPVVPATRCYEIEHLLMLLNVDALVHKSIFSIRSFRLSRYDHLRFAEYVATISTIVSPEGFWRYNLGYHSAVATQKYGDRWQCSQEYL